MSQGPVTAVPPESGPPPEVELLEPPSEPELELELPLDPELLERAFEPELLLEPELPLAPELPLDPDVPLDPELPVPPLAPELDDSLVSPAVPASGDPVEMPPLGPQAEIMTEATARIQRVRALMARDSTRFRRSRARR